MLVFAGVQLQSSSFPTWPARGTRFALHQEISHGLLALSIAAAPLIFC